jgi:hypothetical protein
MRMLAFAAALTAGVTSVAAQQRPAQDVSPLTREIGGDAAISQRVSTYVHLAIGYQRLRNCPVGRGDPQKSSINRHIAALRAEFMQAVPDPYWRGAADNSIALAANRLALEIADEVNARRPPSALARACAEAAERVVEHLLQ